MMRAGPPPCSITALMLVPPTPHMASFVRQNINCLHSRHAVTTMHTCVGVANRDIKLENCLLHNEEGLPHPLLKLCDFGYSKVRLGTL